jgi:hypothetical protein
MMNIQGASSAWSTAALEATKSASDAGPPPDGPPPDGVGPAATSKISGRASFLSELSALKDSDPAAFKAKLTEMSSQAREAAKGATGEQQTRLTQMADKLAEVAESGDLSALQPPSGGRAHGGTHPAEGAKGPPPGGGGGGGHGGGGGGGAKSASSTSSTSSNDSKYAAADANKDGVVSEQEQATYNAKHPEKAQAAASSATTATK